MHMIFLIIHVSSGSLALAVGPLAMLMPKRPGWHPRLGIGYQALMALLCASAIGLAALKPSLWWLGLIATVTWAAALAGWWVRRHHGRGWVPMHIALMCGSYVSLVTALLVVNMDGSPLAWRLPTLVASPLITWRVLLAVFGRGPTRDATQA